MKKHAVSRGDRMFDVVTLIILLFLVLIIAYPLYFIVIASFSDPNLVAGGKIWFIPRGIQWDGYVMLLTNKNIWTGYGNSILYTVVGTAINLAVTLPAAYALSSPKFPSRRIVIFLYTFAMIFQGGIVPTFLIVKNFSMLDTIWALTIPNAYNVFNLIVARSFFETLPSDLSDAATIDGCNDFRLIVRIILPLSGAMTTVLLLYYGVEQWNGYFNALIYIRSNDKYPLQVYLRDLLILNQRLATADSGDPNYQEKMRVMAGLIKYGAVVVATLPLMLIYPLMQKNFVKGVLIGAVKE